MKKVKDAGIIIFAVFLVWGILNIVSKVFLETNSTDIVILDYYNIAWIGYILAIILLLLNIASLYAVFAKKIWGVKIIYAFIILNVLFTLLVTIMSFMNFEVAKEAYLQSRINRGLSMGNADQIMTPVSTILMIISYVAFYLALFLYIRKKKSYFSN
jgi:hypothetical protein